eukprot:198792_1
MDKINSTVNISYIHCTTETAKFGKQVKNTTKARLDQGIIQGITSWASNSRVNAGAIGNFSWMTGYNGTVSNIYGNYGNFDNICKPFKLESDQYINGYRVLYDDHVYGLAFHTNTGSKYECMPDITDKTLYKDTGTVQYSAYYLSGFNILSFATIFQIGFQFTSFNQTYQYLPITDHFYGVQGTNMHIAIDQGPINGMISWGFNPTSNSLNYFQWNSDKYCKSQNYVFGNGIHIVQFCDPFELISDDDFINGYRVIYNVQLYHIYGLVLYTKYGSKYECIGLDINNSSILLHDTGIRQYDDFYLAGFQFNYFESSFHEPGISGIGFQFISINNSYDHICLKNDFQSQHHPLNDNNISVSTLVVSIVFTIMSLIMLLILIIDLVKKSYNLYRKRKYNEWISNKPSLACLQYSILAYFVILGAQIWWLIRIVWLFDATNNYCRTLGCTECIRDVFCDYNEIENRCNQAGLIEIILWIYLVHFMCTYVFYVCKFFWNFFDLWMAQSANLDAVSVKSDDYCYCKYGFFKDNFEKYDARQLWIHKVGYRQFCKYSIVHFGTYFISFCLIGFIVILFGYTEYDIVIKWYEFYLIVIIWIIKIILEICYTLGSKYEREKEILLEINYILKDLFGEVADVIQEYLPRFQIQSNEIQLHHIA